jgi:probable phosphoglycerate mutase
MTTIYLVRHGRTAWTGKRLIGSIPGVALDTFGSQQAENLATRLEQFSIQAIYSSPYQRAVETATPFSQRVHLPVNILEDLREIGFGELAGMGEELQNQPVWQQFLSNPADVQFPNRESVAEAQKRIVVTLEQLADRHADDEHILCVAHCEIIRLALAHVLCIPLGEFMRLTVNTASISCIQWNTEKPAVQFINRV